MKKANSNGAPPRSKRADFTGQYSRALRQRGLAQDPSPLEMDYRVQTVIDLMAGNLCRQHSVDDLAQQVNLSPSRLWHLFKAETGLKPMFYLKQLRLKRTAELLLLSPYKTVNQIQGEVGMRHESHFYDDFKRAYGVTPTEFRRRHLAAHFKSLQANKLDESAAVAGAGSK